MNAPAATRLRANLVLFSLCVCIADAGWLVIAFLSGHHAHIGSLAMRSGVVATALAIMFAVRGYAQRAFDVAKRGRHVHWNHADCHKVSVSARCPNAWLVQLHLELHATSVRAGPENPDA